MRPEVGTQAQFRKKKPPVTYRYDSSLSPALDWDGQNPAREFGEWLIAVIEEASRLDPPHHFPQPREFKSSDGKVQESVDGLHDAAAKLRAIGKPFLNWAGKAEQLSFDVPTLPLFVHERLSTEAIIETLKGHRKDEGWTQAGLFADPQHSVTDQVLKAYEYRDDWVNRLVLGDSLVVMNSLLHYENLGGQVQMIYMDPPYGVKFGSNFQPFVRRREVKHNDDGHLTREPEMVQAYRDTWESGVHSYLSYLRDRLCLCYDLLHESGSMFLQIGDENVHHAREIMEEVFGEDNLCCIIPFAKTASTATNLLATEFDYLLWYAKNLKTVQYRQLFTAKALGTFKSYRYIESPDGKSYRPLSKEEKEGTVPIPEGWRVFQISNLASQDPGRPEQRVYHFEGKDYDCGSSKHWKTTNPDGMDRLAGARRITALASQLNFKRYLDDFPAVPLTNLWSDTGSAGYSTTDPKLYVVQTDTTVVQRCMLMTTDPGDLVLDPSCGSGTTAYVAERWGRRWLTIDVSRVPVALAQQRLLTATFPWYELNDEARGPASGFGYRRKQNQKGEEVGGIVPHITLKSIANNEEPKQEVLVDRPETVSNIVRVTGPFTVEATIPTPVDWEGDGEEDSGVDLEDRGAFVDRMLEVLRKSPVLRLEGNRRVALRNVRPPAKTLSLSAEAMVSPIDFGKARSLPDAVQAVKEADGKSLPFSDQAVAIVFGPENGAVSEKLVYEAAREAHAKDYAHLYVIGFAVQPNARKLVDNCEKTVGVPATYVQATPDLMMGDLLKNMRSSQIFSVCGLPEVRVVKAQDNAGKYQVELLGLDIFDPTTMEVDHRKGDDVPAWFLDTDYNALCFHVCQAFFPRTGAWEHLKKALRGTYDESVWDHLAGMTSAPFEPGEHGQIAVKVIDDRGNELLVVKDLKEAER